MSGTILDVFRAMEPTLEDVGALFGHILSNFSPEELTLYLNDRELYELVELITNFDLEEELIDEY